MITKLEFYQVAVLNDSAYYTQAFLDVRYTKMYIDGLNFILLSK